VVVSGSPTRPQKSRRVAGKVGHLKTLLGQPAADVGHQMHLVSAGAWSVALASELDRKSSFEWFEHPADLDT
jgi:hypothetical protein